AWPSSSSRRISFSRADVGFLVAFYAAGIGLVRDFSPKMKPRENERGRTMAVLSEFGKSSLERAVGRFMRQYDSARETQQTLITSILRRNAGTVFGKEHGFRKIR